MKVPGLNYNTSPNELQESPVIVANAKQNQLASSSSYSSIAAQSSSKKVWRLKKYHRSEDEIKNEQQNYENLEFNQKKSHSRRPKSKNTTGQQEFVFVDLSPTKKSVSKESETITTTPKKDRGSRVSRLFRLNNSNENAAPKEELKQQHLLAPLAQPEATKILQPIPCLPPTQAPPIQPPQLKRSYTTANAARYLERSSSSASLVMTVSENGRAVLQPSISRTLSTSSSVSDLYSLSRGNSTRHSPIPSPPRRTISPLHTQHLEDFSDYGSVHGDDDENSDEHEYEFDEAEADATKAFSRVVKRQASFRKRANTCSSNSSIPSFSPVVPRLLTRNQSISSINSAYKSRISPSRSTHMLRQSAMLQQQHSAQPQQPYEQDEFAFTSFFDDLSGKNNRSSNNYAHKKTSSISDSLAQLGPPLEINSSETDPESPYTANTDVMYPFAFGTAGLDHTHPDSTVHDHTFDDTLKAVTSQVENNSGYEDNSFSAHNAGNGNNQFFDFNAFITYDEQHF